MKALQSILTVSFLLIVSLCSAQKSKLENARNEIAHKSSVWVSEDPSLNSYVTHWVTDELDLVLTKKLRKIESLSSVPGNGHLSEDIDGNTLILAQPFLSCGIGHYLYKLTKETSDELVFTAFWPEYVSNQTLTFQKKVVVND